MFIGGAWTQASTGRTIDVRTPIDGSVVARVQGAGSADVNAAVEAAYNTRAKIRDMPAIQRITVFHKTRQILLDNLEDYSRALLLEAGKPIPSAESEVKASADRMEFVMQEARKIFGEYLPGDWAEDAAGKIGLVIREPLGVVAAISPFNYPLFAAVAKAVPALLAGNTVVAKAASDTPISLLLLGRAFDAAGLPHGVFNILTGRGSDIGDTLVSHPRVRGVTFTGSTEVGKHLASMACVRKQHLELGGKGMAIVLDDADLKLAATKCVQGSLSNAGQRCDAISAILVVNSVADEFSRLILQEASQWRLGDPREQTTKVGPVINKAAAERIQALVDDAVRRGGQAAPRRLAQRLLLPANVARRRIPRGRHSEGGDVRPGDNGNQGRRRGRGAQGGERHTLRFGLLRLLLQLLQDMEDRQAAERRWRRSKRLPPSWCRILPLRWVEGLRRRTRGHRLQHRGNDEPEDDNLQP